jgi:hypothetical protein
VGKVESYPSGTTCHKSYVRYGPGAYLGKLFQPNLMFVGEARSLPYREALERYFIRLGSIITRLEKLAIDKHSSL